MSWRLYPALPRRRVKGRGRKGGNSAHAPGAVKVKGWGWGAAPGQELPPFRGVFAREAPIPLRLACGGKHVHDGTRGAIPGAPKSFER